MRKSQKKSQKTEKINKIPKKFQKYQKKLQNICKSKNIFRQKINEIEFYYFSFVIWGD